MGTPFGMSHVWDLLGGRLGGALELWDTLGSRLGRKWLITVICNVDSIQVLHYLRALVGRHLLALVLVYRA